MPETSSSSQSNIRHSSSVAGIFAGISIGLLVGLTTGMSVSPVVGIVLGALSTGLLALLGLAKQPQDAGASTRVAMFGLTCAVSILAGVEIRTHSLLSPSPQQEIAEWTSAGFDMDLAQRLVIYEHTGEMIGDSSGAPDGAADRHTSTTGTRSHSNPAVASTLFAYQLASACEDLSSDTLRSLQSQYDGFAAQKGALKKFAEAVKAMSTNPSESNQQTVLDTALELRCRK